jgi:hypothetical protein
MAITVRSQGRYANLLNDIFLLFASPEWQAESFMVVPYGFVSAVTASEYAKFDAVISGVSNHDSLNGILYISIFTPNGLGPTRAYQVADLFDKYLAGNSFKTQENAVTQFRRESNFEIRTKEDAKASINTSMLRSTFQIQFSHFRKE